MSRTFHPRRPADDADRRASKARSERKRALYSFKRINGVRSARDAEDTMWEPAPVAG